MTYQNILVETKAGVMRVTVNRPQVLNALDRKTVQELMEAFAEVGRSSEVRAAILTGSGEKSFVSGADIQELAVLNSAQATQLARIGQGLTTMLETIGKPVIAAVNGFALGGGCELAMACTARIASENARFGQPEVKLGIIPGYGGTQRLPRLVGKGRALEIILTGGMIGAEEAYRIGLVNKVVPLAELMPAAEAMAQQMIANAPLALRCALEAVHRGLQADLETGLALESTLFGLSCGTEDMREGTQAFLEKRKPEFKGR